MFQNRLFGTTPINRKVASYLGDVLEDQRDKLAENLLAGGVDLPTYITHFRNKLLYAFYPIGV